MKIKIVCIEDFPSIETAISRYKILDKRIEKGTCNISSMYLITESGEIVHECKRLSKENSN